MRTPLRYAGGKTRAYEIITKELPPFIEEIVSPFMGGGSLEVKWSADLGIKVRSYDVFNVLVNFWKILIHRKKELAEELKKLEPNKETFDMVKEKLFRWEKVQKNFGDKTTKYFHRTPEHMDEVVGAAYYFFNHNMSYGPMFLAWPSSVYLNQKSFKSMIENIENFEPGNLEVEESSFEDIIENNKDKFLYLDPPYHTGDDKDNKMECAIYPNKNFPVHHKGFDHEKLRDLLHNHKGKFILSYNNCEIIRNWYSDFEQKFPKWQYSMGNGETRISKGRMKKGLKTNVKESHEILIIKR